MFFFSLAADHRNLHSFPTRRSSDLHLLQSSVARSSLPRCAGVLALLAESSVTAGEDALGAVHRAGEASSPAVTDRKSTRLNSSHSQISYAVFCLKKKKTKAIDTVYK